ncbi:MAG: hypothetical protein LBJ10_05375, partial [Clostridiales bacterium]|nr:hypothetical protein [Clostridiales bacterium]
MPSAGGAPKEYKKRSLWIDAWRRLKKNKSAVTGLVMTGVILA